MNRWHIKPTADMSRQERIEAIRHNNGAGYDGWKRRATIYEIEDDDRAYQLTPTEHEELWELFKPYTTGNMAYRALIDNRISLEVARLMGDDEFLLLHNFGVNTLEMLRRYIPKSDATILRDISDQIGAALALLERLNADISKLSEVTEYLTRKKEADA